MTRSIQVNIYLTQELLDRIDEAARTRGDNRSEWIRGACEKELEEQEKTANQPR